MNVIDTINLINQKFNNKYANEGILSGSGHNASSFFTTQSCWYYAYMLKELFPKGEIYLGNLSVGHVIFELDNNFYDVNGYYYFYNEDKFYPDKEIIGTPAYDHPKHREVTALCNSIVKEIKTRNNKLENKGKGK